MSERRHRERRRRQRMLALVPAATSATGADVQLALRLRNEATLTGRCACGAVGETFEVLDDGSLVPAAEIAPGGLYYTRFEHEHDCPAGDGPYLDAALDRGEIDDPAGDLLRSLLERRSA